MIFGRNIKISGESFYHLGHMKIYENFDVRVIDEVLFGKRSWAEVEKLDIGNKNNEDINLFKCQGCSLEVLHNNANNVIKSKALIVTNGNSTGSGKILPFNKGHDIGCNLNPMGHGDKFTVPMDGIGYMKILGNLTLTAIDITNEMGLLSVDGLVKLENKPDIHIKTEISYQKCHFDLGGGWSNAVVYNEENYEYQSLIYFGRFEGDYKNILLGNIQKSQDVAENKQTLKSVGGDIRNYHQLIDDRWAFNMYFNGKESQVLMQGMSSNPMGILIHGAYDLNNVTKSKLEFYELCCTNNCYS